MFDFVKMQALGNDFIIINENEFKSTNVKKICDRHFGIGADGIILYNRNLVKFINADGTFASTCGNGLRCISKYLYDEGIIKENNFEIKLENRNIFVSIKDADTIEINMGYYKVLKSFFINFKNQNVQVIEVNVSNNHFVVFYNELANLEIEDFVTHINKEIVHEANLEFIKIVNETEINMRVWERGVGETKACGSGACASLVASNYLNLSGASVKVNMLGGTLDCVLKNQNVYLLGSASYVFKGTY